MVARGGGVDGGAHYRKGESEEEKVRKSEKSKSAKE